MQYGRKLVQIIGTVVIAGAVTSGADAQMGGGGMMGGSGGGMMGRGMMGGSGMGSGDGNGYGPRAEPGWRNAAPAPEANRPEASNDRESDPLDLLDLSRKQIGAINIIREGLRDRQSNVRRRLETQRQNLGKLYDAPQRDRAQIDAQFRRIEGLRRELFESSIEANERIEAQLTAGQRQHLRRIAPRWMVDR